MVKKSAMAEDVDPAPPLAIENPDLVGHGEAESVLLDAFLSNRMHHAWLISGPKGIGKATLAHRFAKFVLAHGGANSGPGLFGDALPASPPASLEIPAENPLFQRIVAGGHADLMVVERRAHEKTGKLKTVIDVDSIRDVGHFLRLTAAEGGWRVVVIDCADDMNPNAANAVLKILEEPPRNALLILVSHNPGRLLATLRSRCRALKLRPLSSAQVRQLVQTYAPDVSPVDADRLVALADGSVGQALNLVQEGGVVLYGDLLALLHSLPNLDVPALYVLADKIARVGADQAFATVMGLLRWWLERMVLNAAGKPNPGPNPGSDLEGGGDESAFMNALAAQASLESWFRVWDKINHLVARAGAVHLDKKQVILDAFLSLESTVRSRR